MQIYHVTQCYSYYTPLGALGVIQKLNLKTRAKSEYLVPFDMFFFCISLKREDTKFGEKEKLLLQIQNLNIVNIVKILFLVNKIHSFFHIYLVKSLI